jgi:hypothetical protein
MKWQGRRASTNVEDRRGAKALVGGGIGTLIIAIIMLLMGGNPLEYLGNQSGTVETPYEATAEEQKLADFASVVLAETEEVWTELFKSELGKKYQCPSLVLFSGGVQSACGAADSSTGPFYCPGDQKVYLDLSFFTELKDRFMAPGDFAMAYVIAHEVGHHVQYQLGILDDVYSQREKLSTASFNKLMVKLELQADYFAGVWAHHVARNDLLDEGDVEEALNAASAVGDDRIQKEMTGRVNPDSFTHGTSQQRSSWFLKGFKSGTIAAGDTFNSPELND